jgi:NADH-quinone oxidoreductase subunit M
VVPTAVFCSLTLTRPHLQVIRALGCLVILVGVAGAFITATQLVWWLVTFELLLLASLYLLRLTSKSERINEAVTEMFLWTVLGSACLLLAFCLLFLQGIWTLDQLYLSGGVGAYTGLLLLLGFGVKLPVWPCFSWLLKAHVEASVEFSILLSGVIVKLGAVGLYRVSLALNDGFCGGVFMAACTLAIIEATLRLLAQRDLKRVVALTTIIEMNWVGLCLSLGGETFDQIGAFLLVAHSLTTTAEFFMVEVLYRRWGVRDAAAISGVAFTSPLLFSAAFVTTLITIGFPLSSLFIAKVWFLAALFQVWPWLAGCFSFWFLIVLPLAFMRLWVPIWFGQPGVTRGVAGVELGSRELWVLVVANGAGLILGLWPELILSC